MSVNTLARELKVREKRNTIPSVSIVLPFDPKMTPRDEWEPVLKAALSKAEKELLANHAAEVAMPVITKLQAIFHNLDRATDKRSIAVFVSAGVEKVIYMDVPVEETIVVDSSFRLRDLVNCRIKGVEFLVLLLSARESKMYKSEGSHLRRIKPNIPQSAYAYLNEVPEGSANFSDTSGRRETMLDKFLHHMDEGLSGVLKVYPLPVFVLGDSRVAGHFSKITHNDKHIAGYIYKSCMETGEKELQDYLRPLIGNWQKARQQNGIQQVEKARNAGKLAAGIEEVSIAAKYKSSHLLMVERGLADEALSDAEAPVFYIYDKVDDIIEKVLENGGDVVWVEKDQLRDYGHIALIQHY